ncbi:MAG: ClpXP protease specificity-enhancing factor SspB [Pseudomonadota bacterium]|nr:ClpXP protease specificity-enhancing factor SspB [Pseudomonadota bacterium]
MALGSSRPYLIRALYDWIVNGGEDPYVVVDCFYPGVEVPESHVKDGKIVLNLAPRALKAWNTSDFGLMFQTRFSGVPTDLVLPYGAITAIYGKESGLGMGFGQEPGGVPELPNTNVPTPTFEPAPDEVPVESAPPKRERPALRIVKSDD